MKITSFIAVSFITSGLFTVQAQAQESSLERVLSSFVKHAVVTTTNELQIDVKQVVANTAYRFSLTGESVVGKVSVTDIAKTDTLKPETIKNKQG
ncbi:hypothetical protein CA267_012940 [Alteromonas pelagimontana]|uniref:Uncharacterized protein n=1 Tax=Alteromonas pelagimontana TaxID=1858656 RepID=A0A6M4MET8_9ALTE|nr:hypothetical protein [Alteromonas pelagimontana]QJR81609.1 hypothetical protein CA267_012940 [Alteromonas pelagimontana]